MTDVAQDGGFGVQGGGAWEKDVSKVQGRRGRESLEFMMSAGLSRGQRMQVQARAQGNGADNVLIHQGAGVLKTGLGRDSRAGKSVRDDVGGSRHMPDVSGVLGDKVEVSCLPGRLFNRAGDGPTKGFVVSEDRKTPTF